MIKIGRLAVHLDSREIFVDANVDMKPTRLGSRAFDILELLIQADGALVSKDQILSRVWPDTVVEENNLQVHMSALRKLLGEDRGLIKTIPGRGYRLSLNDAAEPRRYPGVASAVTGATVNGATPDTGSRNGTDGDFPGERAALTRGNLPAPLATLIGRETVMAGAMAMLSGTRLLSLTGAGGIGKTTLAIETGRRLGARFTDGVHLVSLAAATNMTSAVDALAKAFAVRSGGDAATLARIVSGMGEQRLLIILDNCEQILCAAAAITEAILQANPFASVLTTSREPLRLANEQIFAVPPLQFPAADAPQSEVLQCSAVRLFLARARAIEPSFLSDEHSIVLTGTVCRRLDGLPLAIELAASRAAVLGIETLAAHLDDRFRMLTGGHRTALPRHQTLKATLDWSYALLDGNEQATLRALGVFCNGFTLDCAVAVMRMSGLSDDQVIDAVSGLVSKSLAVPVRDGEAGLKPRRYRLLETTRAYALQKLEDHGELRVTMLHHATHMLALLERVPELAGQPAQQASTSGGWRGPASLEELDDIRSALRWTFSKNGDTGTGLALAVAACNFFFDCSLVQECCEWAQRGLYALGPALHDNHAEQRIRMTLLAALAAGLVYSNGPTTATRELWRKVLLLARLQNARGIKVRALWGLWNAAQYGGDIRQAQLYARAFYRLAEREGDADNVILGDRLQGIAQHYAGEQDAALQHLNKMLAKYDRRLQSGTVLGASIDHRIVASATLARVQWLKGRRDKAFSLSDDALNAAIDDKHDMMISYVLVEAGIPLAILSGRYQQAHALIALLQQHADRCGFSIWNASAAAYTECLLAFDMSQTPDAVRYGNVLQKLEQTGFRASHAMLRGAYAVALARGGNPCAALLEIDNTLKRCALTGDRWFTPELWRLKGELLRTAAFTGDAASSRPDVDDCFDKALCESIRQGAASFQLRAASSVARRWRDSGRGTLVGDYLTPMCTAMSGARHCVDYNEAVALIAACAPGAPGTRKALTARA